MTEESCRICRCESTPTHPLYHPCKCRGSIKFIHEDCLTEWLTHSGRDPKCDICHTPYHFKVLFDKDTPETLPLKWLLWSLATRFVSICRFVSILTMSVILLVIQVPSFLMVSARFCKMVFVEDLPQKTMLLSVLFGNAPQTNLSNFAYYTWFDGLKYLLILVFAYIVIFVENEWVVHDEGFPQLIVKKIGPELRKYSMADTQWHPRMRQPDPDESDDSFDPFMANDVDLQDEPDRFRGNLPSEDSDEIAGYGDAVELDRQDSIELRRMELQRERDQRERQRERDQRERNEQQQRVLPQQAFARHVLRENPPDAEFFLPNRMPPAPPLAAPIPQDIEAEDGFPIDLVINLNFASPFIYALVADIIAFAIVLTHFFFPYSLGSLVISSLTHIYNLTPLPRQIPHLGSPTTFWWGFYPVSVGAACILASLVVGAKFYESQKPVTKKSSRLVYVFILTILSTLKIFTIFSVELLVFPIYCGALLDLSLAPIITENWLLTSLHPVLSLAWTRVIVYWASGTLYMCIFALFVGMLRTHVLRKGVLFFIRSPDDPNARLVHDALMRPLSLQLSRIALSGLFYTAFLLLGIGATCWAVHFLPILPLALPSTLEWGIISLASTYVYLVAPDMAKPYIRTYWKWAFGRICSSLKLSSFLLNMHVPQERGHIVYRSFFHSGTPDYTRLMSDSQAADAMKSDPSISSIFVPDGNYVRAPDSDSISRKFLKKMFVPVTKNDQVIAQAANTLSESDSDDDSYEEIVTTRTYHIVYRPPWFMWRIIGLLLFVWAYASVLIVGTGLVTALLGKPFTLLSSKDPYHISLLDISVGMCVAVQVYSKYYSHQRPRQDGVALWRRFIVTLAISVVNVVAAFAVGFVLCVLSYLVHTLCIDVPYFYYTSDTHNSVADLVLENRQNFPSGLFDLRTYLHLAGCIFTLRPLSKGFNRMGANATRNGPHILNVKPLANPAFKLLVVLGTGFIILDGYAHYLHMTSRSQDPILDLIIETLIGKTTTTKFYVNVWLTTWLAFVTKESAEKFRGYSFLMSDRIKEEIYGKGRALTDFDESN